LISKQEVAVGKRWPLHPRRTVTVGECLYDTF
jgi:hypothetical protein